MRNPLKLISKKEIQIVVAVTVLVTLVTVIGIVLGTSRTASVETRAAEELKRREEQTLVSSTALGIEDFYFSAAAGDLGETHPIREPKRTWSSDEVSSYWIDPSNVKISALMEKNDEAVRQAMGVPEE